MKHSLWWISVQGKINRTANIIYSKFFDSRYHFPLIIPAAISIILVLIADKIGEFETVEDIILHSVGNTAAVLFSIIFASVAIILAISESTLRLSRTNTRWFFGFIEIIKRFKAPIIFSLLLVASYLIILPIDAMIADCEFDKLISMAFIIFLLTTNLYIIIRIGEVSMEMLSYIRAAISETKMDDEDRITFTVVDDKQSCKKEISRVFKTVKASAITMQDQLNRIADLEVITKPEWKRERLLVESILESTQIIIASMEDVVFLTKDDVDKYEIIYDKTIDLVKEGDAQRYHNRISGAIATLDRNLIDFRNRIDALTDCIDGVDYFENSDFIRQRLKNNIHLENNQEDSSKQSECNIPVISSSSTQKTNCCSNEVRNEQNYISLVERLSSALFSMRNSSNTTYQLCQKVESALNGEEI